MKVYSLNEAMQWFLENASGSIVCVRFDGTEKECISYLEATTFYGER